MNVLKAILIVAATISIPVIALFLIRLTMKVSRSVDHINRTLDDARPQINMLLFNLNRTLDEVNVELEEVGRITVEAREALEKTGSSLSSLEETMRSPVARLGGLLAGFATTTILFRCLTRRTGWKAGRSGRRKKHT